MTDERAFKAFKNQEPVYFVDYSGFEYFVKKDVISKYGIKAKGKDVVIIDNNFANEDIERTVDKIYDNFHEAKKACKEMQREYGKKVITQKEYDEYMELKKAYLSLGNWIKVTPETMPPEMQLLILTVGNWCDKNKIILPNKARLCCGKFEIYENGKWDRGKLSALRVTHWAYYPKPADD